MAYLSHIFIGGHPRTGTDLLRNILNSSPDVAICGETHFLGTPRTLTNLLRNLLNPVRGMVTLGQNYFVKDYISPGSRQEFARVGDICTDAGLEKVVDHIYTVGPSFWRWLPENIAREVFVESLKKSDRTDRSLFDCIMRLYAAGKPICGEKTLAHIHYLPTLFEWFPDAKFIHSFRDPRAIFVSRKKRGSR